MTKGKLTPSEIESLRTLAIYLEGLKKGQGHLDPIGTNTLEVLWKAIKLL